MSVETAPGVPPWPPEFAARYRAAGYWRDQDLGRLLWTVADANADRVALVAGAHRITYRELMERSDALAEALLDRGLRPGDTVVLQLPNCWEFVAVLLACLRSGIAPVLALVAHREHELRYLVQHTDARLLIVPDVWRGFDHETLAADLAALADLADLAAEGPMVAGGDAAVGVGGSAVGGGDAAVGGGDAAVGVGGSAVGGGDAAVGGGGTAVGGGDTAGLRVAVVGGAPRPGHLDVRALLQPSGDATARRKRLDAVAPDPDALAFFLLSGGTTGQAKLIGRSHNDYEYACRRMAAIAGAGRDTVYLAALPAAHNFALGGPGVLGVLAAGGRVVLLPSPEPVAAFRVVVAESPTITSLVPAVALRWAEHAATHPGALASLRIVQVGGSVLDPAVAAGLQQALGARLQQVFGMAEGLLCCTRPEDPDPIVYGTQGRPVSPGDEIRILDPAGAEVADGEVGELLTRGPYTPRGYYRSPAFNAERYTPDGWYRTGDRVRRHPSGNLVVAGRSKDLVNRGGEKISAEEVETLARELLGLRECAVVAVPDARFGERVCLVTTGGPLNLDDVRARLHAGGVAKYKLPEQVEVVPALPLTPIGKVDKVALSAQINGGTGARRGDSEGSGA
ncbi:(2,3-dihydroxybenzoyl)adenylate synthase [Dactylosporangium sp. CS-047395]|uniref:(2,3-dihydroxybenzoyl)adenylate synthase n=1 Tax=Dactylosporangium sp. CS-047395 TaxID=3239936 RepID=UPI003D8BB8E4